MIRLGDSDADLRRAAGLLAAGELVAFPTETVYGLGADASNPDAVRRIFEAKGRPPDHPVIVHLPGHEAMRDWAATVPAGAEALARTFWPGPLTLVLQRRSGVSDTITGGQATVGLRVPGNPVALRLLSIFGGALAAPSANRFGHLSPTRAEDVIAEFGDEVAAVVDGGPCQVGVESTILDLSTPIPRLLRPGMIALESLASVLGEPIERPGAGAGPRAPGRLASHYAPRTRLELVEPDRLEDRVTRAAAGAEPVAVLVRRGAPDPLPAGCHWIEMPDDAAEYARALYGQLRRADGARPDRILVERPPDTPAWEAVVDRLERAAGGRAAGA